MCSLSTLKTSIAPTARQTPKIQMQPPNKNHCSSPLLGQHA
uniref:Uncharacterized protein n=1 Tax=Anguilla anguilla TaxID=7936 RepID=A0A0E9VLR3_ANGAN